MSIVSERLLAVHAALEAGGFPHAFGGAIALAYCIEQPYGTRHIDVNVFVGVDRADDVLDAFPRGLKIGREDRGTVRRDGQVRLFWDEVPIDVFFDTHEFHHEVALGIAEVPFDGSTIPVLGCEALIVFKAMFNRSRDWADIEAIVDADEVIGVQALQHLRSLLGNFDAGVVRLSALVNPKVGRY